MRRTKFLYRAMLLTSVFVMCPALSQPGLAAQSGAGEGAVKRMQFDASNAPGWSLMSAQERKVFRDSMLSTTSYQECLGIQQIHIAMMIAKAEKTGAQLVSPPQDVCEWMAGRGLFLLKFHPVGHGQKE